MLFDSKGGTTVEQIRNKYKKSADSKAGKDYSMGYKTQRRTFKYIDNQPLEAQKNQLKEQAQPSRPERMGKIWRNPTQQKQNENNGKFSMEKLPTYQEYISVDVQKRAENLSKPAKSKNRKQQVDLGYRTQRSAKKYQHKLESSLNVKNPNLPKHNMDSLQCIRKVEEIQQRIKSLLLAK